MAAGQLAKRPGKALTLSGTIPRRTGAAQGQRPPLRRVPGCKTAYRASGARGNGLHSVNSRRLLSFAGEGLTGFEFGQVNVLYDRIKIGPQSFVSRVMDTVNLDRVEFLKGPSSLMSGDGAIGGAVPPEETAASRPPPPDVDARKRLTSRICGRHRLQKRAATRGL